MENGDYSSEDLQDMVEIAQNFPVCGSDKEFYERPIEYCAAKIMNPELIPFECPAPCNTQTCCRRQCTEELEPVLITGGENMQFILQNKCHADCYNDDMTIEYTCNKDTSVNDCRIEFCIHQNECLDQPQKSVCGFDGEVYYTNCEADCRGIDFAEFCVDLVTIEDGLDVEEACKPICLEKKGE